MMDWVCIFYKDPGELYITNDAVNNQRYMQILEGVMIPSVSTLMGDFSLSKIMLLVIRVTSLQASSKSTTPNCYLGQYFHLTLIP